MYKAVFTLLFLFTLTSVFAQEAVKPKPSPTAIITMKYDNSYVKVTYSQPHRRGRQVFGGLVPYGQVWRTGANEATEITTTSDLMVKGENLPSGTYSVFTIPGEEEWTIIFNSQLGLWGAYNYNEDFDVLSVKVPVEEIKGNVVWEPFTMEFEQVNDTANLVMKWEKTKVSVPLTFATK